MSSIGPLKEHDYTYTGYIRMFRQDALDLTAESYIVLKARDEGIAPAAQQRNGSAADLAVDARPVMLAVKDELKEYIARLLACPYQEARMLKRFHFDQYCELRRVDVLDESFEVVKTVKQGQDWRPFIGEIKEAEGDGQEQPDAENDGDVPGGVR